MSPPPSSLLLLLWGLVLGAGAAWAQAPEDAGVAAVRASFEYGKYAEVLERAQARIDEGRLSEPALLELHKLAGVSAFNLGRQEATSRHFRALLRLDPDFALDPFVVPPPAVAALEELRRRMASELDLVRQERKLRLERERAETERRERERLEAEQRRRRLEQLARQITVRRVERRSFLVNFVPFGAGQFQQGRNGVGTLLAATQGVLAATSILSYFAHESLYQRETISLDGVLTDTGRASIPVRYIPTARAGEANTWRALQYGSGAGFYAAYVLGVVDALVQHRDEVVVTTEEARPEPSPTPPASSPQATPAAGQLQLYLVPGGAGAGLTLQF